MKKQSLSRFLRHREFLRLLCKCSPPVRKALLKNTSKDQLILLVEIVTNLLLGNVKISKATKSSLKKYKTDLRKLANITCCLDTKRKIIQKGSGAFIVPIISSLLASVVGSLISNKINQNQDG